MCDYADDEGGEWRFFFSACGDCPTVSKTEAEVAKLALETHLTNSQASAMMKWSNKRLEYGYVILQYAIRKQ